MGMCLGKFRVFGQAIGVANCCYNPIGANNENPIENPLAENQGELNNSVEAKHVVFADSSYTRNPPNLNIPKDSPECRKTGGEHSRLRENVVASRKEVDAYVSRKNSILSKVESVDDQTGERVIASDEVVNELRQLLQEFIEKRQRLIQLQSNCKYLLKSIDEIASTSTSQDSQEARVSPEKKLFVSSEIPQYTKGTMIEIQDQQDIVNSSIDEINQSLTIYSE